MVDNMPTDTVWTAFGIGRSQFPMAAQSMLLGGNVRVGLEDNLWLDKGVPASNESLVAKASTLVEHLGGRVLSVDETRTKLRLPRK